MSRLVFGLAIYAALAVGFAAGWFLGRQDLASKALDELHAWRKKNRRG